MGFLGNYESIFAYKKTIRFWLFQKLRKLSFWTSKMTIIKETNETTIEVDTITKSCSSYSTNPDTGNLTWIFHHNRINLCNWIFRSISWRSRFNDRPSNLRTNFGPPYLSFYMVPDLEIHFCSGSFSWIHNVVSCSYNLNFK